MSKAERSLTRVVILSLIFSIIQSEVSDKSEYILYKPPNSEEVIPEGVLTSIGSDSLIDACARLLERYKDYNPRVTTVMEAKGSSTAVKALLEGTAQIGPMTRQMTISEKDKFQDKYGFYPTSLKIGKDAIVMIVNKSNPIERLQLRVLEQIFSKDMKCRNITSFNTWGEVISILPESDLNDDTQAIEDFKDKEIVLLGRTSISGTHKFFKEECLCNGEFKDKIKEFELFDDIVQEVISNRYAIGYAVITHNSSEAKSLSLSNGYDGFVYPTIENVSTNKYPLAKYIYMYISKAPYTKLDELTLDFVRFVLSEEGQGIIRESGYINVTPALCRLQLIYLGENYSIFVKSDEVIDQGSSGFYVTLYFFLLGILAIAE